MRNFLKKFWGAFVAPIALISFLTILFTVEVYFGELSPHNRPMDSVVKIELKNGHGSGVHIGNGYYLTAAHVVKGEKEVSMRDDDGVKRVAKVMWINEESDIALLFYNKPPESLYQYGVPLKCSYLSVGNDVTALGNPAQLEFVASYGKISSGPRNMDPYWEQVYVVDTTMVMGMSGGPMFDANGNLYGINVGVLMVPLGFGGSLTGFGMIVPSKHICDLMGIE